MLGFASEDRLTLTLITICGNKIIVILMGLSVNMFYQVQKSVVHLYISMSSYCLTFSHRYLFPSVTKCLSTFRDVKTSKGC